MKNNAVYKVDCLSCEYSYVGQTKRCFKKRKSEHKNQKSSAILQHMQQTSHNFNGKGFKLLDVENNQNKRDRSEMLRIKLEAHSINEQEDTARLLPINYIDLKSQIFNDHKHQ